MTKFSLGAQRRLPNTAGMAKDRSHTLQDDDAQPTSAGPAWADTTRRPAARFSSRAFAEIGRAVDTRRARAGEAAQFEALHAMLEHRFDALDAEAEASGRRDALILERLDALARDVQALQKRTEAVARSSARLERRTFDWRHAPYWALGAAGVVLVLAILL